MQNEYHLPGESILPVVSILAHALWQLADTNMDRLPSTFVNDSNHKVVLAFPGPVSVGRGVNPGGHLRESACMRRGPAAFEPQRAPDGLENGASL